MSLLNKLCRKSNAINNIMSSRYVPSASDVKQLRELTGSPIGECQKALKEGNGDIQIAKEYLKKKGLANAEKRLDKQVKEGAIGVLLNADRTQGVMVEVNCETDFVAKTDLFQKYVDSVLKSVLKSNQKLDIQNDDVQGFINSTKSEVNVFDDHKNLSLIDTQKLVISKLQENIKVSKITSIVHNDQGLGSYVHNSYSRDFQNIGRAACVTQFSSPVKNNQDLANIYDNLAMQILGSKPKYITKQDVPQDILQAEIQKIMDEMKGKIENKPKNIIDTMVEGKLKKFYSDNVLFSMESLFESEQEMTVEQFVTEQQKLHQTQIQIKDYLVSFLKQ